MTKTFCYMLILSLLGSSLYGQQQNEVPNLPAEVKALAPAQHELLGAASADLNGDGLADYVVVAEAKAEGDEDPTRTVFVITQKPAGKFAIAARSDHAVIGKSDGGGMGDPFDSISARKNGFTLSHFGGRREKWTCDYIFGYSATDHAWQLTRIKASRWSETAEMQTFQPPHDFGKIAFEDFDAEKWQGVGAGYRQTATSQPPIP